MEDLIRGDELRTVGFEFSGHFRQSTRNGVAGDDGERGGGGRERENTECN